MNCLIPSNNVKVLARGLQALAKVGDDVFIEFKSDSVSFVTLNQSKTVCTRLNLLDSFFSTYEVDQEELEGQTNHAITCKLHMKVLLPLFKGVHLDKKLDYIKIEYSVNSDIMSFKMKYKCDNILMIHKLRLMDNEVLKIGISTDSGCNNMCNTSSFYNQLLSMFSNYDDEITLEIEKTKLLARNYFVGAPPRPKHVRSQVTLNAHEFLIYKIENETSINFSLRPFRTAIHFADGLNLNVGFNFEKGGRPISVLMKNPTFELIFMIATLNPYSDAQSTISTSSIPAKITQLTQNGANITVEDQEAILNQDWGDFDEPIPSKTSCKTNTKKLARKSTFEELMKKKTKKQPEKVLDVENVDIIPNSPESPRSKRAKMVFGRCMDPTFSSTILGEVLAGNSDSE